MKTSLFHELVVGIPINAASYQVQKSSKGYLTDHTGCSKHLGPSKTSKQRNALSTTVRLAAKLTETVRGKLSLGARILQVGGIQKAFKHFFKVREGEKLLNAFQCYLSTTAGPLAGLLFISTDKVAFCSERSIKAYSPNGEFVRMNYKVVIPVGKIKCANQSVNINKPSEKYIELVTTDDFDFWFLGFLSNKKTFKYLEKAISHSRSTKLKDT